MACMMHTTPCPLFSLALSIVIGSCLSSHVHVVRVGPPTSTLMLMKKETLKVDTASQRMRIAG